MKRLIIILLAGFIVSCGGAGSPGSTSNTPDTTTDEPGSPAPSESPVVEAPVISSVTGDGASGAVESALIVSGENFSEELTVTLELKDSGTDIELDYTLDSSTSLTADLPADLVEGDYNLTLVSPTGTALAAVTILKGDQGPAGPQGPAGDQGPAGPAGPQGPGGLEIAKQFFCGPSGDLDPTSSNRSGRNTQVVKYSDGSYFMSCLADYLDGTFLFIDTSSYVAWYAATSVGVTGGSIGCVPFYVTAVYSISGNTVTYSNQADASKTQTVACTQSYP